MAFATNDTIHVFGTEDAVTTTGSSTAADAFTSAGQWTNDDDAPLVALFLIATWATSTNINGKPVMVYSRLIDARSTTDADAPNVDNRANMLGRFIVPQAVTSAQNMALAGGLVALPNYKTSQVHDFYIENLSGQTISANWSLYATPVSYGPKPA